MRKKEDVLRDGPQVTDPRPRRESLEAAIQRFVVEIDAELETFVEGEELWVEIPKVIPMDAVALDALMIEYNIEGGWFVYKSGLRGKWYLVFK